MEIIDIYGKEYTCKKCDKKVNYGAASKDGKTAVTKDKKPFNNVYGQGSNKLSVAVNAGTIEIHPCYASNVLRDFDELTGELPKRAEKELNATPHSIEVDKFIELWDDAWNAVYIRACKIAGEGGTAKDKQITACGMMHDYFSFRHTLK